MSRQLHFSSFLAIGCFGTLAATGAHAQDASNEQKLGGVVVTDTAIDTPEQAIKIDKPASPKFTQKVQDTPQTIQIIGKDLFNQQGATTLTEALRNSPGVGTFYAGENGTTSTGDAIYMRGFDTSNSIFVDGVRDIGAISRDVFNTEQVEVIKGPAGTDNGRSAPTGSINMASKQAKLEDAASGQVTIGTDGQRRATADLNKALGGPNAALRLNAMWQDSDVAGRDHVRNKRWGLASSLGLGLETDTRLYVNLLYVDQDNIPDGFVPTIGLPGWSPQVGLENLVGKRVSSENFYGTDQDHDNVKAHMGTVRFEHDFSDAVRISNIARFGRTTQDYLLTSFMTTSANILRPVQSDPSTYTLNRSNPTYRDAINEIWTDQLNLRADFATGAIEHNLSVGIEITSETQKTFGNAGILSGAVLTRPTNLYNPDWADGGTIVVYRNGVNTHGQTDTQSFYAFDTAKLFDEMLLITGGIRLDHFRTRYRTTVACTAAAANCGGAAVGTVVPGVDIVAKDTLFNWKIGAVFKPMPSLSLYANYALSQQPPGGSNFLLSTAANNANNPNLEPQKARTIEAGVKWSVLDDRLLLTGAVYRTKISNEINGLTVDDIQSGKKRVKGIELSAVGNITEQWSLSAGYSHLDSKVDVGAPIAADGTYNLTYIPGDSWTLWSNYKFPFGLELAAGARHNGKLHRGTDGAVGTPAYTLGYTVIDGLVAFALTDTVKLSANFYNLFDKHYVQSINKSGYRYLPGQPRTFLFRAAFAY